MKLTNIHDSWGTTVEFENPLEFFQQDLEYWRNLIYSRKLLVFKQMDFSKQDYAKFGMRFGKLWSKDDYNYSRESQESVKIKNFDFILSPISNKISPRLGQHEMQWHSDIPNRNRNPFPMRSLWMVDNPNPDSGLTTWLNIEDGLEQLPDTLSAQIPNIKIIQQSWYEKATEIQEFNFIKTHPITNKSSLRLNFFCDPENNITDAWIKNVTVNGILTECKPVLGPYLKFLENQQNLLYTHKWDTHDIIIYDNWPFVHNRTQLDLKSGQERLFYRINIDHITDAAYTTHKQLLKFLEC
jgi:alpha-ketoglutarate-dependent taurine dioxygenase